MTEFAPPADGSQTQEERFVRAWVPFFEFPFDAERMEISIDDVQFREQATQAINALPALLRTIDEFRPTPKTCDRCKPGGDFYTHTEEGCQNFVGEMKINGVRMVALCACTEPEPHTTGSQHAPR